jgi:hypothetical protein
MKHPVYLVWAALAAGYLHQANTRGWSLVHDLSPARLFSSLPSSSGGVHHK